MPEYRRISAGPAIMCIWEIAENEEQLKSIIGGDSFPVLTKFSDPGRRLEWLATRCSLKSLGVTDTIIYAPNRRPFLSKGQQHISISHSSPFATLIVSTDFYVGVDIESLSRRFESIADRYLTLGERAWIDLNDVRQMALVWSAKEALYKLPGMEGLNSFVDVTTMPITQIDEMGHLQMRVRLGGRVHMFHFGYLFLASHVVTWVTCNPRQMDW